MDPMGVPPIVLRNCASMITDCLVKLFQLCLSKSTFPSWWKFAYIQPVPKKGDRSNSSNYRPIALISCLSKVFNVFSIRRFLNIYHFTIFYLIASMASIKAALLVIFWISLLSLGHPLLEIFGETFAIALDISKAFDRVQHKALISRLLSNDFYPSLCYLISVFISDPSIVAVVDSHCSLPKTNNSNVSSELCSVTHSLLFFIDLSQTFCPIHSYTNDTILLHFSYLLRDSQPFRK